MAVDRQVEVGEIRHQRERDAYERWKKAGMQRCRSCKAPVLFARNTVSGSNQIIDAMPDWERGNIHLVTVGIVTFGKVWNRDDAGANRDAGVAFHLDHHVTCPQADEWRKKPAKEQG